MALLRQNLQTLEPEAINERLRAVAKDVEVALDQVLPPPETRLHEAMRYSVLGGGKRIRAFVACEASLIFNVPRALALQVAAVLELIQAYSLVHDDLPCMDNADMRRGKPSCHAAFGEATAILVGDALIPLAYQQLSILDVPTSIKIDLIKGLSETIGSQGLVAGQMLDLRQENPVESYEDILELQRLKTGVFFGFAAEAGALLGKASQAKKDALRAYGLYLGEAFQMMDDLLDGVGSPETLGKPCGQDSSKLTFLSLLGPDQLYQQAEEASQRAIKSLRCFGDKATPLCDLARHGLKRMK